MRITDADAKVVFEAIIAHGKAYPDNKVMNFRYFKDPDRRVQVFVHPPLKYTAFLHIPPPENNPDAPDAQ